jgi:hypothetical protein
MRSESYGDVYPFADIALIVRELENVDPAAIVTQERSNRGQPAKFPPLEMKLLHAPHCSGSLSLRDVQSFLSSNIKNARCKTNKYV